MIAAKTMSMVLAPFLVSSRNSTRRLGGKLPRELVAPAITLGKARDEVCLVTAVLGQTRPVRKCAGGAKCLERALVKRASLGLGQTPELSVCSTVEEYHCPRQTRQQGNRGSPPQSTYAVRSTIHVASIVLRQRRLR